MPLVPKTDMPPSMPRRGLNVRAARATPSGMEMVTTRPPVYPWACAAAQAASRIMARGIELMAAAPTGWSSPALVTRPTPTPPSITTSEPSLSATRAMTRTPSVMSGSSPASFCTEQTAHVSPRSASSTSTTTSMPAGVDTVTEDTVTSPRRSSAAALVAAAAQVPVVYPQRKSLPPAPM